MIDNPFNILNEVVTPDLTSTEYANGMKTAFETINDNFKKIIAAPIFRGQQGKSVKIKSCPIWTLNGNVHILTEVGKQLVAAIYGETYSELEDVNDKVITSGINSFEYLIKNNSILFFYLNDENETLICPAQVYPFMDLRIGDLNSMSGIVEGFHDKSCYVSFEWKDDTYRFVIVDQFPKIMASTSLNEYVWKLNGIETNITVRGMNGKDASIYIPIFKVDIADDNTHYNVISVWSKQQEEFVSYNELTQDEKDAITIQMTCFDYIVNDEGNIVGFSVESIVSKIPDGDSTIIYTSKSDFSLETKTLDTMLSEIAPYKLDKPTGLTFLYIPANTDLNDTHVHALWRASDDEYSSDAYFGYAKRTENAVAFDDNTTTLTIGGYSNIKTLGFDISNNTISSNSININGITKITSGSTEATFDSDNIQMKADKINLTGNSIINIGVANRGNITIKSSQFLIKRDAAEKLIIGNKSYQGAGPDENVIIYDDSFLVDAANIRLNGTTNIKGATNINGVTTIKGSSVSINAGNSNSTVIGGSSIKIGGDSIKIGGDSIKIGGDYEYAGEPQQHVQSIGNWEGDKQIAKLTLIIRKIGRVQTCNFQLQISNYKGKENAWNNLSIGNFSDWKTYMGIDANIGLIRDYNGSCNPTESVATLDMSANGDAKIKLYKSGSGRLNMHYGGRYIGFI